jgi:hypothetical protein
MEQLTKDELAILANMLSNANVPVKEAEVFTKLLAKLLRMAQDA